MKKLIFFLSIVALITSCSTGTKESGEKAEAAQQKLWDEVMAVHDEVMPRMGEINRLKRQFSEYLGTTEVIPDELKSELTAVIGKLQAADEGMMNWMAGIKEKKPETLRATADHETILAGLKDELKKVDKVKEDILSSLKEGTALLAKIQPEEK
ncbi:MAG: hypothetical protein GY705_18285 [Bacteroidetes bacterium]|nr:hypothetical protein [Bacteroidota bacterium]